YRFVRTHRVAYATLAAKVLVDVYRGCTGLGHSGFSPTLKCAQVWLCLHGAFGNLSNIIQII
ncbi:hypothetical protein MUO69_02105, partial [Candidatus Bathyarchaeota archaeon]|nr:hypothetical protein [Candidatus Bathyarchaeota archaeon]